MKLKIKNSVYSSVFLFALAGSAFAGHAAMGGIDTPQRFYVGVLGGGGATSSFNTTQYGTAFYLEAQGGPLAVDAFGHSNNRSTWLLGLQAGYQAPAIILNTKSQWALVPAVELEAFYLGKTTFSGDLTNDQPGRLPEHDFLVSYPMQRSVFLVNAVLNYNIPCSRFHPYVGAGFGSALVKISGADASQVSPPEPGVNHYNTSTSDQITTFAGQLKAGLSYNITDCINVFAEYRWLYMADTHFMFGSTVYAGHPTTSNWSVKMNPQYTNLGAVGLRFSW
jgi:opacity protein-like surface antigen